MAAPTLKKRKVTHTPVDDNDQEVFSTTSSKMGESSNEDSDAAQEQQSYHQAKSKPQHSANYSRDTARPFLAEAHHSSLFKFKLDELLAQVRPDYQKRMVKAENALRKLKEIIENIPSREPLSVSEAEQLQSKTHGVTIPFPEPRPRLDTNYKLAYSKPTNINVIGSYARKTAIKTKDHFGIDLAITMPSHLFQEKDYLNYRYFYKRAYYLACLASGLQEDKASDFDVKFHYQNDNHLQPIIILDSGKGAGEDDFGRSKCQIRILLAADAYLFPLVKILPDKNCLPKTFSTVGLATTSKTASALYNASLRSECSSLSYLKYLHSVSLDADAFNDACVLGSVWLRQRGLRTGLAGGGFGPFEWACTIALLLQGSGFQGKPPLSTGYSSYQMFKATLQYLSASDLIQKPAFVKSEYTGFAGHDGPLLFDGIRGLNILFKMTPWSYAALRHEASNTLKLLNDPLVDQFNACFITRLDHALQKFDRLISFPVHNAQKSRPPASQGSENIMTLTRRLHDVLTNGLGDRISLAMVEQPATRPWPLTTSFLRSDSDEISIGLLTNPEYINRSVDKGPPTENKEAAAGFREFWGDKAELRRFKDGSIVESLIWSNTDSEHSVLSQIINYVIGRHFGKEKVENIKIIGDSFDYMLPSHSMAFADFLALYQPALSAFETLERNIRGLEGLPLHIRQVSAGDPQLRYTSLNLPFLDAARGQMSPAKAYVQFEGSARWPDDLTAVQRTKFAFLMKIGELLEESIPELVARVGLEDTADKLTNAVFMDIFYPSGASFQLRIHHERELSLLERTLKSSSHSAASRETAASALSAYKRNFIQLPLHTQAVRALSTRFPPLSPSVRLMKKWRDCHLLSDQVSDELIELLTTRVFVHPCPWSIPGSAMTGFLRTLSFLSTFDWRSDPLIMDFNDDMSTQDIDAIKLRFEAWRKIDPAMNRIAMFVASNIDPDGTAWTETGPSKVIAAHLTSLAGAAIGLAKEQGVSLQPEALFVPSLVNYDFIIHLDTKVTSYGQKHQQKQSGFKNLQIQDGVHKSFVGFEPVQLFITELRSLYGSNVLFFHNRNGGSVIAGLWNPQTGPRSWKVNIGYSTLPVEGEDERIAINKEATLHDIGRLGGDMISKIESKR